jgi:hypothetical protein
MVRLNQPVENVRQFFSFDSEFARGSGAPHGQYHGAGAVLRLRGLDVKQAVALFLDRIHGFPGVDIQICSSNYLLPKTQQLFLGKRRFMELSI